MAGDARALYRFDRIVADTAVAIMKTSSREEGRHDRAVDLIKHGRQCFVRRSLEFQLFQSR